jgi:hypothetical protein
VRTTLALFLCSINDAIAAARKASDAAAFHADAGQWVRAGVELGTLGRIGGQLADLAQHASDAAVDDELAMRQQAKGAT